MKKETMLKLIGFIMVCLMFSGCALITDLEGKSIAAEVKVIGLDASVPTFYSTGPSFCSIKIGYISTKYVSAPKDGKADIKDDYNDLNFWTLSGSGHSEVSVSNTPDTEVKVDSDTKK